MLTVAAMKLQASSAGSTCFCGSQDPAHRRRYRIEFTGDQRFDAPVDEDARLIMASVLRSASLNAVFCNLMIGLPNACRSLV